MRINDIRVAEHFLLREFECPCCRTVKVHPRLVAMLQNVREAWGGPLVINSGYRCRANNARVGGVPKSRHMLGAAADVRIPAKHQSEFRDLAEKCGFAQIILYKKENFVHLEI